MPTNDHLSSSDSLGAIPSPATPGVWMVNHRVLRNHPASRRSSSGPPSSFNLFVDVPFVWPYPASSAFLTGTFSNWETTIPMTKASDIDAPFWVIVKPLPPGDFQYKFIIDNVWRHAPDQPITFDERGIVNNVLAVSVEACGDETCFCSNFYAEQEFALVATGSDSTTPSDAVGVMTPQTLRTFQSKVGVAYRYTEREEMFDGLPVRKAYMHSEIDDRPFDVTVVDVQSLPATRGAGEQSKDGTISRASSFEDIYDAAGDVGTGGGVSESGGRDGTCHRYDPYVPVMEDAAYAATLNDQEGSLPRTAPYRASALSSDPTELAYSVRARLSSPVLGFNPNECHNGIRLTDTNHCAIRMQERGLYKTVRSVLSLRPDSRCRIYYEFLVLKQATGGGVCVGLSTKELPLNCLCGTRPNSIGFSTSGNLIRTVDGKESWTEYGSDLDSGCSIGCLATVEKFTKESVPNSKTMVKSTVEFFVDGQSRGEAFDYVFFGDLEVFPTLSLFAKNARVYSLFEGEELLFKSSLPDGVQITTLDGRPIVVGTSSSTAQHSSSLRS